MKKITKGLYKKSSFLKLGLVIFVASVFVSGILITKLSGLLSSKAIVNAPPDCVAKYGTDCVYDNGCVWDGCTQWKDDIKGGTCLAWGPERYVAPDCGNNPPSYCPVGTTLTCGSPQVLACKNDVGGCRGSGGRVTGNPCNDERGIECQTNCWCQGPQTPTPTPTPSRTPTPSPSPTPLPSPTPKPTCTPTVTPTITPTPTVTPTPVANAILKICKYNDANNNGAIDNGESTMAWNFFVAYQGAQYEYGSQWWDVWSHGCRTVSVPAYQWITVSEEGRSSWVETAVLADNTFSGTGNYNYISQPGVEKDVWFLNYNTGNPTPTPTGVPNYCGGTCGSNTNCQPGLFCYITSGTSGFCRNPNCQTDTSCGCAPTPAPTPIQSGPTAPPVVLGATAPPVLPKTGSNTLEMIAGLLTTMGVGVYIFRKFKLI